MRAEKLLDDMDYEFELKNIPPEISADCGLGLKFASVVNYEQVYKFLARDGIEIEGLYYIDKQDKEKNIDKIR
jgi:hypothetical protein